MQDKMKQNIRLTESDLNKIIKHSINEIVNRINLQFINGFFYPTDAISTQTLADELELGRIPEDRLDVISPKLIRRGYKLAISNYYPQKTNNNDGYISSYEAMYLEDLGLLKMDFLALKNITLIDNILNDIKEITKDIQHSFKKEYWDEV